jgi:phosphoribosylglycinamide formyltransferase-1
MKNIAIFASGNGTNAEAIIQYFENNPTIVVKLIVCNNPMAYVVERAKKFDIPTLIIDRIDFYESDKIVSQLRWQEIDLIVLAGFLWKVPDNLIETFPKKIINIHPALLPKHGGKGMYGNKVHTAVKEAGDLETGITIHYLNEQYDDGEIIFQAKVDVKPADTIATVAEKVQKLELENYPRVIEGLLSN